MDQSSRFRDGFIDDLLQAHAAWNDVIPRHLVVLASETAHRRDKKYARDLTRHLIGNMVVLAFAGIERAIEERRLEQYRAVMRQFEKHMSTLRSLEFEIPPQIEEAVSMVKSPQLWD